MPKEHAPAESVAQGGFANVDWQIDEAQGREIYTFAKRVMDTVDKMGLARGERPRILRDHEQIFPGMRAGDEFDGRLPMIIRKLTFDQLSALYSLFSNWFAYVMTMVHAVMVERSEAKRQKDLVWALVRQQYKWDPDNTDNDGRPKKRGPQEMTDLARQDSRFVEVDAKYEELNSLYNYLQAMALVAEQDMKVISREVTIQQTKIEHEYMRRGFGSRMSTISNRSFMDNRQPEETDNGDTEDQGDGQPVAGPVAGVRKPVPIKKSVVPTKARARIQIHKP